VLREQKILEGRFCDMIVMSLLDEEWFAGLGKP